MISPLADQRLSLFGNLQRLTLSCSTAERLLIPWVHSDKSRRLASLALPATCRDLSSPPATRLPRALWCGCLDHLLYDVAVGYNCCS